VLRAGYKHDGIDLRFHGESHRIDFADLVGEAVWLYPQNEVFVDLAAARERDGGQVHYSVSDTEVFDLTGATPKIRFTDSEGRASEIRAEIVVGADGSGGISNGPSRRITAPTTSSSIPSPGSASWSRHRRARMN